MKRVLRMTEGTPLQQLAPEIQPSVILDDDPPEWWVLRRKHLWHTPPMLQSQSAGEIAAVGVSNPAGSNQIVVVLGFRIITLATGPADLSFVAGIPSGLALTSEAQASDLRLGSVAGNTAKLFPRRIAGVSAAITRNQIDLLVAVGAVTRLPWFIALAPGWTCLLTNQTANEGIQALMWGYNRYLTPEELSVGQ